jgi:hypothetical protein
MQPPTIKTDERIFIVHPNFNMGRVTYCNLEHLPDVIEGAKGGINKIMHLWNGKHERMPKKDLKAIFEAFSMDTDVLKLI